MKILISIYVSNTINNYFLLRIKSTCCVQFSNNDQASETKMALNGVTWPVGNPKTLRVSFTTEDQMKKYKEVRCVTTTELLFVSVRLFHNKRVPDCRWSVEAIR